MKGSNFSYLVKQGIVSVWRNRMMSFASFCILMVSLLLIGLSTLIALDISIVIGNVEDTNEVIVFVYSDVQESRLKQIEDIIANYDYVGSVIFFSKEEAWDMMKQTYGGGFEKLYDTIGYDYMPYTFIASLNDIIKINEAVSTFERIDGVEYVSAPYDFAEFLISMRTTFTIIGGAALVALIVVCLVIVYNTARTSVFARRMQISIMKHVGATNAFIKFPFFIEGMFIGILAGAASWFLTKIAYESVIALFSSDITLLNILGLTNLIGFHDISWYVLAANCVAGAFLGALGTIFSMGKHLKV